MKKIILILALLSLGVSKAQVVGGYLPLNSTKSFTAGNSTFSNVIARGTLSVGSTATVSGDVLLGGSTNTNNYNLNLISSGSKDQQINFRRDGSTAWGLGRTNTNARFGIAYNASATPTLGSGDFFSITNLGAVGIGTISPTATLDVVGNAKVSSTFSLGSANLTGGNTGTVAVLSDITVPYQFAPNTALNPSDGDIRYCGVLMPNFSALYTATSAIGFYVNDNIEVVRYDIQAWNNGTVGTAESITVSLVSGSSSTLGLLNNTITSNSQSQTTSTCSINVNAGTRILIEYKFPTYATNPTSVWFNTVIYTRRRT